MLIQTQIKDNLSDLAPKNQTILREQNTASNRLKCLRRKIPMAAFVHLLG